MSADSDGKGGVLYVATPGASYAGPMKIINSIFNSDLVFNLRREEDSSQNGESGEVGVSGRDYALVPGETWLQALKWCVFKVFLADSYAMECFLSYIVNVYICI